MYRTRPLYSLRQRWIMKVLQARWRLKALPNYVNMFWGHYKFSIFFSRLPPGLAVLGVCTLLALSRSFLVLFSVLISLAIPSPIIGMSPEESLYIRMSRDIGSTLDVVPFSMSHFLKCA